MEEKDLEKKLIKAVREKGGIAYKFVSPGNIGMPDRLVILPNNDIFFIEVKKPKEGKLSPQQEHQIEKLTGLGCYCYVLDDPEKIDEILNDFRTIDDLFVPF